MVGKGPTNPGKALPPPAMPERKHFFTGGVPQRRFIASLRHIFVHFCTLSLPRGWSAEFKGVGLHWERFLCR